MYTLSRYKGHKILLKDGGNDGNDGASGARGSSRHAAVVVEPVERNGADHDGDERRGTSQTPQLTREHRV